MNNVARLSLFFYLIAAWGYAAGSTQLTIDGVYAGSIMNLEGGDPRGTLAIEPPVGSALPKKHISGVRYQPITFEVPFPFSAPVLNWIKDLCANRGTRRTLLLAELDFNLKVISSVEAVNALLTEVRFPGVSAASRDQVRVTLVITPESTKTPAAPPKAFTVSPAVAYMGSNYKLAIDGLPTAAVSKIEAFTIKQPMATATPEFSNLIITAASTDAAAWYAWRDSFVVNGLNKDDLEKNASLVLSGNGTAAATLLELQFRNVGIVRATPEQIGTGGDGIKRFQAEVYYETITLIPAPLVAMTSVPLIVGSATPASTPAAPAPTTSGTNPQAGSTTTPALGTPIATAPGVSATREPGAIVNATSTADQGGRDPQNFPRLAGTVRKSYSSIQQKTGLQEMATYTKVDTLDAIEASYMKALTGAGWELTTRYENNEAVGRMHQIILNWKNGLRTVGITLTEAKAGASEMSVNLMTKI